MKFYLPIYVFILSFCLTTDSAFAQVDQISIARVELMPNEPSPFFMRDWKIVASAYDSFVYDVQKTGEHLPLIFIQPEGTNYPENASFGLDTYVGTVNDNNGEGINVLPSLVGASLVGIDKTNQFGRNWILMSQDYFNKANGEMLYLNNIGGHSGNDWWYDMMPNIYFYQLYDLYGPIGDAENQFDQVSNKMNKAVRTMGGSATPWTRAYMDYRAWDFLNMVPNATGVHEPEAAGAYAWLLYHSYHKTGDLEYLQAAEWSMEYLINLSSNPSYELQLPYGAYAAAKMNAEIGTKYNIEKLLYWVFNRGPIRGWGTIVGTWNIFDVSGLVGEANDGGDDYAFQLNGTQQAGALVPLVRYDKRFARTIGKWVLNVANATRLMYPGFLPAQLMDASEWSADNDPQSVIGYEALREQWMGSSPFATGDALKGGWAATNLSLYSTSSIGYLGALIEQTNDEKILQLDLLKTDFFKDAAYPSYLYYNPYTTSKTVLIDVGNTQTDIYDVVSETFLAQDVTGETSITIPADEAISIVLAPAGGTISFENNKLLIDDVIVDYQQTAFAYNFPPRIQAFSTENNLVEKNSTITIYGKGIDQETKDLTYTFFLPNDTLSGLEKTIEWTAPDQEGEYILKLVVEDEDQLTDTMELILTIVAEINISPEILELTASKKYTAPGGIINLVALVDDENGDPIAYSWTANSGTIVGITENAEWTAPGATGIYTIQLMVTDGRGGMASRSIQLLVLDPSLQQSGEIIAWYPFAGNANDISGNNLHGQVFGPKLTADSLGNSNEAYFFDGVNDHIQVSNEPILNFEDGITLSFFAQPQLIGDRERFMISHGSWQNRWKVSVTPERRVRWTLKNDLGQVRDLDSESIIEEGKYYHIGAAYDGHYLMLYINGQLESFTAFTGNIAASTYALELGQMLPDDPTYNFRGILDEVKIYDYALDPDSIAAESGHVITGINGSVTANQFDLKLYPNPAGKFITLELPENDLSIHATDINYTILDNRGRNVLEGAFEDFPTKTIDLSNLISGVYIIHLTGNGKIGFQKFIIE